ncbi:MAG: Ger(x)C family spore germination protein [Bacillota bacterium]|nr:Ger(x)C family spore germination protein [Bacillota bacterium]
MKKIIISFFIAALLLCGCVQKEILDDVNLETGVGYDLVKEKIRGTALVPVYQPDKSVDNKTFTASSKLSRDFLNDVQRQSPDPIVTGSLEVVLFGKELSERGILDLIDSFQRDPSVGAGLYLAVVDGESKKIIQGNYGNRGTAIFISNLIRHNMLTKDVPKTNLQLFLSDFYQIGKTSYLPQLKKKGKNQIMISGISLFKYGKVVDTIPGNKMFFFKLLVDNYSEGTTEVKIGKEIAAIQSVQSKNDFKLSRSPRNEVDITLKINAILNEFSGNKVTKKEVGEIEKKFKKDVERECMQMTERFQKQKIDPIGLGHFVKSKTRNFDIKKWWREDYPKLKVNIKADVTITESGVIE